MHETKRPLKVFLCHASIDKPKVRELYRYLRRRGVNPWFDEEHLVGGQDWQVEIPKALAASDAIIICLTKNSVDKEGYIQREIKFALEKALEMPEGKIFLIPVKFEECEVPFSLSRYQWVDLTIEIGYSKMMKALKFRASQLERSTVELSKKTGEEENLAIEKATKEKIERESAEKAAREKAEKESAEKARLEAEELARQKAAKEKAERESAEKAAREKAEKESAEKARLEAEELARQKAAKEKAERESAEKAAREKAEKESAEKARLEAEELARQKAAKEKAEREAAEKAAHEKAEKESAEKARLEAEELARQKAAKEKAERKAAEKTAGEKIEKEVTERARLAEQARLKSAKEKEKPQAEEKVAHGKAERENKKTKSTPIISIIVIALIGFVGVICIVTIGNFSQMFNAAPISTTTVTPIVENVPTEILTATSVLPTLTMTVTKTSTLAPPTLTLTPTETLTLAPIPTAQIITPALILSTLPADTSCYQVIGYGWGAPFTESQFGAYTCYALRKYTSCSHIPIADEYCQCKESYDSGYREALTCEGLNYPNPPAPLILVKP